MSRIESGACEYAKLVLDNVGIVSDTCLSGEEALVQMELKAAKHEGYDLILLDLMWKCSKRAVYIIMMLF